MLFACIVLGNYANKASDDMDGRDNLKHIKNVPKMESVGTVIYEHSSSDRIIGD